ncbi:hypothetical protein [Paenibacillus eucommiae]|uniref:Uncharacterized protein n=1 Tax=Paenibacillus eucommiae TaxID=1355755 RepID=A0ABS4J7N4_9BACL|nr:hypothetical protein [Paenibacillus eucommiae]MBP1995837.1 hypothetical protein [Paenibacillus eucommiae]
MELLADGREECSFSGAPLGIKTTTQSTYLDWFDSADDKRLFNASELLQFGELARKQEKTLLLQWEEDYASIF